MYIAKHLTYLQHEKREKQETGNPYPSYVPDGTIFLGDKFRFHLKTSQKNEHMKIANVFFFPFLLFALNGFAQSKRTIFFQTGYTFNNSILLNEEIVEKSKGYSVDAGFTYRFFTRKWMSSEIGVSGKTIFAVGRIQQHSFKATTFRLTVPLKFVFPIPHSKYAISSGFIFQNNVDFTEFDFRLRDKYAWRVNYCLEGRYLLNPKTSLLIAWHSNIRTIPDPYFVNDPKMNVVIGLTQAIHFKRK